MKKRKYVYDPRKQIMMVFEGNRNLGGFIGRVAERRFVQLLDTGAEVCLGEFLTAKERIERMFNQ